MRSLAFRTFGVSIGLVAVALSTVSPHSKAGDRSSAVDPPRKVLVELYSSQGCNSCPPASDLLGKLASLGSGSDQIVPINFHVDYFNTPWVDPFSDASFSQRQQSYNQVKQRDDLYFTPMMMVDGRSPLLGSDRPKALAAIRQARTEPAGVALQLALDGKPTQKVLNLKITARTPEAVGRDLLIGLAVTEDPVTTKVLSGENAGRTLVEHHVVRRFDHKFIKLDRAESQTLTFPVELPPGGDASRFRVAVFAQDRGNGKVHQADAIPWNRNPPVGPSASRTPSKTKPPRKATAWNLSFPGFDSTSGMANSSASSDDSATVLTFCPDCGSMAKLPLVGPPAHHSGAPVAMSC